MKIKMKIMIKIKDKDKENTRIKTRINLIVLYDHTIKYKERIHKPNDVVYSSENKRDIT